MKLTKTVEIGTRDNILFAIDRVPSSDQYLYAGSDFGLYSIDLSEEKPQPVAFEGSGHGSYVTGAIWTPHGVITCGYDRQLIWWDDRERKSIRTIKPHARWVRGIAVTADHSKVASVADDMTCVLHNAGTGEELARYTDHEERTPHNYPSMLYAVAFSPDGKLLATGDRVGHVVIRSVETGKVVTTCESPGMYTWDPKARRHSIGGIRSLAFSPDSKTLAVGGIGKIGNIDHLGGPSRVELFDVSSGESKLLYEDGKLKGLVEQILWHPDGKWFLIVGGDNGGFVIAYPSDKTEALIAEKAPMHIHECSIDFESGRLVAAGHQKLAVFTLET